jgi:uncharacterized repeat protein (TIGR03803 family)
MRAIIRHAIILSRVARLFGIALVIMTSTQAVGRAQEAGTALPPLSQPVLQQLLKDPEAWRQFRERFATRPQAAPTSMAPKAGLDWTRLDNLLPGGASASNPLLLTDGTVLIHQSCTSNWFRLKPDINGSYQKGTWSTIATMPDKYAPRFFASAVLQDGRVIVEGGEYNNDTGGGIACGDQVNSTLGAIYDPRSDTWTSVDPPSGWATGGASSTVLADRTFLLADCCTKQLALLDSAKLTWTATGTDKFGINNEENWTLLPNGGVLTVDAYVLTGLCGMNSEEFVPQTGKWIGAGSTIVELSGCSGSILNYEAPTQILRPNGKVVAFGATASKTNLPVHTATYNTATKTWAAGPNMPAVIDVPFNSRNYTMADAPAAILPNGNVLIAASPSVWTTNSSFPSPTHFFMYDGAKFTQVGDVADSSVLRSFQMNFLVLPTGEILGVETDHPNMEIFPAVCCSAKSWAPTIASFPSAITDGTTYTITGTQFNGLTYGASFGDDEQANTNYPLVRVTNTATKEVSYCATFNFSSMGVATGNAKVSTQFSCDAPEGASTLEVVANGIASAPVKVAIALRLTTLYSFCTQGGNNCTDGATPNGLIMDASGNLYGTTRAGGTNCNASTDAGCGGTVFELTFNSATGKYDSAVKTLYAFCRKDGACANGSQPDAGLIMDASGNLYGTTADPDAGTVFELTFDSAKKQYASAVTTLYAFCQKTSCLDGDHPFGGLTMDAAGNLYGVTSAGGNEDEGTIFELTFDSAAKKYASAVKTLYSFCPQGGDDCTDGYTPSGRLFIDPSGNLFGTASGADSAGNYGTVFVLPYSSATHKYASAIQILYRFCQHPQAGGGECTTDGISPEALIMDASGNLYGTTLQGGTKYGGGIVFELPFDSDTQKYASADKILYRFCSKVSNNDCTDGYNPNLGLIMDQSGNLYGTTSLGGLEDDGTVFELPFNSESKEYASAVTTLHSFCPNVKNFACADGNLPSGGLIQDGLSGTLYGTTSLGGAGVSPGGTVFEFTP